MKELHKAQDGFTLVELLVAVTIFAVGLLAVASMQITALQGNSTANTLTAATGVAEGILEEILSRDIDDPEFAATATHDWIFPDTATTTKSIEGAGDYTAQYDITVDYDGVPNLVRVEVRVEGGGRSLGGSDKRRVSLIGFKRTV